MCVCVFVSKIISLNTTTLQIETEIKKNKIIKRILTVLKRLFKMKLKRDKNNKKKAQKNLKTFLNSFLNNTRLYFVGIIDTT